MLSNRSDERAAALATPVVQPGLSPPRRIRVGAAAALAALLAASAGGLLWWEPWQDPPGPEARRFAYPLPDKPSIAVLPFINVSGEAEQDHFAAGLTDDLITELSKVSGLFVIARHSVFAIQDTAGKIQDVAAELGVRYVLEGSLRRAGPCPTISGPSTWTRTSPRPTPASRASRSTFGATTTPSCGPGRSPARSPTTPRARRCA